MFLLYSTVHWYFFNTAGSLFLWQNLAHFGIPYLCPLNPVNQAIKTFRTERSSNQGQFLPISNPYPGHKYLYRWHVCKYLLLFIYVYIKSDCIHFAKGSEQCVELHILRLSRALSWQIMFARHEHHTSSVLRTMHWIDHSSMGHV